MALGSVYGLQGNLQGNDLYTRRCGVYYVYRRCVGHWGHSLHEYFEFYLLITSSVEKKENIPRINQKNCSLV